MAKGETTTLEDIAATQAEHTLFLARIAERLDEHTSLLQAIETSIQLLAGNITNMRTELLVIKALVAQEYQENQRLNDGWSDKLAERGY